MNTSRLPAFKEEEVKRIEAIRNRPPKPGVITCNCCYKYFRSKDTLKEHYCGRCEGHYLNRGALGCPMLLAEVGGVSLSRIKPDPSHGSNNHLFNAHPRFKDKRKRHEDYPAEEELDGLMEDDLGVKVRMGEDE